MTQEQYKAGMLDLIALEVEDFCRPQMTTLDGVRMMKARLMSMEADRLYRLVDRSIDHSETCVSTTEDKDDASDQEQECSCGRRLIYNYHVQGWTCEDCDFRSLDHH